jgi:dCTP deaminase
MRVCALTFEKLSSPAKTPYNKKANAKYMGQKSPEPSKISQD